MSPLPDFIAQCRRKGGAILIAKCIAIQTDPESTESQRNSAALWEATMRERHGDPKPGWLAREVERQAALRAEHKAFMAPFEAEFGTDHAPGGWSLAERAAVASCMAGEGLPLERRI